MPRSVTLPALQAMLAQQTSAVFLELLTVDHADLAAPLRMVNNRVDIVSNSETYVATAFTASLPSDTEKRVPSVRITVSNVDQRIIRALRSVSSPPSFTLGVVNAATPDTFEYGPIDLLLRDYQVNAQNITMTVALEDFTQEGWPNLRFDPVNFPGLF